MAGRHKKEFDPQELTREQHVERAKEILYRQLDARDRSRCELAEKLAAKLVPEGVAQQVLAEFESVGYVDDAKFARVYVRSRLAGRAMSRQRLRLELRQKGVDAALISAALERVDPEAELEGAIELAEKKLRASSGDPLAAKRRAYGMLARRGFSSEQCSKALRVALARIEQGE